jgi:pimeloyl-ACP methyl ester carboxylesterase
MYVILTLRSSSVVGRPNPKGTSMLRQSRRRSMMALAVVGLIGAGLVMLPVTASADDHPGQDDHSHDHDHEPPTAKVPSLDWQPCGKVGAQCATATVPLDYKDPTGATITLSVAKRPADDQEHKIGALFFDNGGPGGPNVPSVREDPKPFTDALRAKFDIIGVDPRGVGESSPIRCFASQEEQAAFVATAGDAFPQTPEEDAAYAAFSAEYGKRCAANAGPLLAHITTSNVARDFDLIRQAVGDKKFSYLGFSYGTYLGAVYANLFPDIIRGIVTDGNLDAVQWSTGDERTSRRPFTSRIQSGVGTQATLNAFLQECDKAGVEKCPFAKDGPATKKWDALLERLKQEPITFKGQDGKTVTVTYAGLLRLVLGVLYAPANQWGILGSALENVSSKASAPAAMASMATLRRLADEAAPFDDSFNAVTCVDTDNPSDPRAWRKAADRDGRKIGPISQPWVWDSLPCATWPVKDDAQYKGPWDKHTSATILVVNNLFDPATPYETAVSLSQQLDEARLLTVAGYGHVSYGQSTCSRSAIDQYLIAGTLPPEGSICDSDIKPFDPLPPSDEPGPAPAPDPSPAPLPVPAPNPQLARVTA